MPCELKAEGLEAERRKKIEIFIALLQ